MLILVALKTTYFSVSKMFNKIHIYKLMQFVNAWTKEIKYVFEWLMKRMTTFDLILFMCIK